MRLAHAAVLILILPASAVTAQDGVFNLPDLAAGQVISSTAHGQARRGGEDDDTTATAPLSAKSKAYCENVPTLRARFGEKDSRVVRLSSLCRKAGYRY